MSMGGNNGGGSQYSLDGFTPLEREHLANLREEVDCGVVGDWDTGRLHWAAMLIGSLLASGDGEECPTWPHLVARLEAWLRWDFERGYGDDYEAA